MGTFSVWHILVMAGIILLLFGGQGKISDLMGDVGRGIKAFRVGLAQPLNDPVQAHTAVSQTGRDTIDTPNARDIVVARDCEPIGNKTTSKSVFGR